MNSPEFDHDARAVFYELVARRRDIRSFQPGRPVPEDALRRILQAADQAPSVGYSQPWDFVLVRDDRTRRQVRESFLRCREAEAGRYSPERRAQYLAYQLEGIIDSALNICVTVDLRPADEPVLGTTAQPEALRWSACCAVQNLWLAARVEGIGVGWVSIVEPAVLRMALALPPGIEPVAYLCVGYPMAFRDRPLLEETGSRPRRPLASAIHEGAYRAREEGWPVLVTEPPTIASSVDGALTASIPNFDDRASVASKDHQLGLTKPPGSLGRLEELAAWYAGVRGQFPTPSPSRSELLVFAADHGIAVAGVSAYSSNVTAAMVANFVAGGASANVLARACNLSLTVIDVGVSGDLLPMPTEDRRARFISAKVRAGTADARFQPAMTPTECQTALDRGFQCAADAAARGAQVLAIGEMGIGNSTAAAAVVAALTGLPAETVAGSGTGLDAAGRARKISVVREILLRHQPDSQDPLQVLRSVGGLEIAAMTGAMIGGAASRMAVVVDGFISGAAALVAVRLRPEILPFLCLSHSSTEPGHQAVCQALGLVPLVDLKMRLGEGTGAVLGAHLVRMAVLLQCETATFSRMGIPDRLVSRP